MWKLTSSYSLIFLVLSSLENKTKNCLKKPFQQQNNHLPVCFISIRKVLSNHQLKFEIISICCLITQGFCILLFLSRNLPIATLWIFSKLYLFVKPSLYQRAFKKRTWNKKHSTLLHNIQFCLTLNSLLNADSCDYNFTFLMLQSL